MKSINENNLIRVMVPLFLVVSLIAVVALGEKRQAKLSKQLLVILQESELIKSNKNHNEKADE